MDDALVVVLEIANFAEAQRQVRSFAGDIQRLQNPMGQANRAVQQHARQVQQAAGPWQRLLQAQQRYAQAVRSGNQGAIFDAQSNLQRASSSFHRAQQQMAGPNIGQAFKNAILSTRVGVGGGGVSAMPLIGRTLQALEALGPLGEAAGIAAAGVAMLGVMAKGAADAVSSFAKAFYRGGGTVAETAAGALIGGAAGMSAGDFAGGARAFQQRIGPGGEPIAMMAASSMGIHENMHGFEKIDAMAEYLQAIKKVLLDTNEQRARRAAMNLGLEDFLPLRDLPRQDREKMFGAGGDMEEMFTPQRRQEAAKLNLEMARMQMLWQRITVTIGAPVLHEMVPVLQAIVDAAPVINALAKVFAWIVTTGNTLFILLKALKGILEMLHLIDRQDKHAQAMDRHADALDNNSRALQGIYGGGERTRGAIPAAYQFNPYGPAQQTLRQAVNLGAFAL